MRDPAAAKGTSHWSPGIDVPASRGRADSGDLEIDLTELFVDAASVATDLGVGIALFIDEMQDVQAADVSALCAACHELSQTRRPADRGRRRACRTCRACCRPARATPSGCSATPASTGSTGRRPTWR